MQKNHKITILKKHELSWFECAGQLDPLSCMLRLRVAVCFPVGHVPSLFSYGEMMNHSATW